jgi:hypothetical protein
MSVQSHCAHCGMDMIITSEDRSRRFCSISCANKAKMRRVVGHCLVCGREISLPPCRRAEGRGKYCSRLCYGRGLSDSLRSRISLQ